VHGAHNGRAGISGKGVGLEKRGKSRVEACQIGKSALFRSQSPAVIWRYSRNWQGNSKAR